MQTSNFIGELLGTLVLILLGNGVVANILLKGSKGENGGWIVVTAGLGFRRDVRHFCWSKIW